jgi:2-hydroxycyclohexanecarboxyl-CoA dehydrogenase
MGLKGKTAIVTGGAQGIGRAIALRLARDGANVGILDINKDQASKTAEEVKKLGVGATAIECNVTDYPKVKEAVDKIHKEYGSIDILINNAGIDESRAFVDTDEALWERILNVNYRSFLIASHICIPYMIEQKSGNIVSMGSDAGRIGAAGEVLY